jgi:hypothetical protein
LLIIEHAVDMEPSIERSGRKAVSQGLVTAYFRPRGLVARRQASSPRAAGLLPDLAAVERAETRLAAGTYGLSVERRLEAIPTAERTAAEEGRR